jgi:WhiB family transcriptional regulator, redox-sensing transcriptional regulator
MHSAFDSPMPSTFGAADDVPCAGMEGDLWFTSHPSAVERAKSLCRTCPLQETCLAEAVERREPWGVWGGQLFENGAIVTFKRPRGRPRKDATRLAS